MAKSRTKKNPSQDQLPLAENIEIGAGCGNFGSVFFPVCLLTDSDTEIGERCPDHSIDLFCSAAQIPVADSAFKLTILCNPWRYGFNDVNEGLVILAEMVRILGNSGRIIIIGSLANKYCAPRKVEKVVSAADSQIKAKLSLTVTLIENSKNEYPDYVFRTTDGDETFPTVRIEINVAK